MATTVNKKRHGNSKYDWKRFADGQEHSIRAGTGKRTNNAESLRRQICDAARKLGKKAATTVAGDVVKFTFVEKQEK